MQRSKQRPQSFLLIFSFAMLVFACQKDLCEPPFDVGMGTLGIRHEGPVEAGNNLGIVVGIYASSVAELKGIDIVVSLPPELEVKTVIQPKDAPKVVQTGTTLRWRADLKPSFFHALMQLPIQNEITVWLKAKTDWKQWSYPIKINVGLYFTSNGQCRNYSDGHYSKTITWSHEGYSDPGWNELSKGQR